MRISPAVAQQLTQLARTEPNVKVRSQLASSAKRLPAADGLPIVRGLLAKDEDLTDIHVPLLLWWAIEKNCDKDREAVLDTFRDSTLWSGKLVQDAILSRLMKRFALAGTQKDLLACTELFRMAPEKSHGQILLKGFEEAFKGRSSAGLPPELLAEIAKLGGGSLAFGVRLGKEEAIAKALDVVQNPKAPPVDRVELIEILGETKQTRCVPVLLGLLAAKETEAITKSALTALQAYKDDRIGAEVVKRYPSFDGELRETAETLLLSRREWSKAWLAAVDQGTIPTKAIPRATVRQMLLHDDDGIKGLVRKHWGDIKGATTAEMQQEINRFLQVVGAGGGDPLPGKKLFTARCATCHTLHAQGGTVGPDLTTYKRDDAANLMLHIVNPNAEIREGFETHVIVTDSGRTLNGIVVEKDNRVVVLRTADGQRVVLPRDEIETQRVAGVSLMPEGALTGLSDQDVRDLFAYLRSSQPLNYNK
jgi:putative heme-binding domain-containing protein